MLLEVERVVIYLYHVFFLAPNSMDTFKKWGAEDIFIQQVPLARVALSIDRIDLCTHLSGDDGQEHRV